MSRVDPIQKILWWRWAAVLLAVLAAQVQAQADPPGRVGLLNHNEGSIAFSPAGDTEWMDSPVNRPLTQGDRVWADRGSRAELHAGAVAVRLEGPAHLAVVALDERVTRFFVAAGTVQVRLRELYDGDNVQLDTANLSFRAVQAGDYRIDVDANGTTRVTVHSGTGLAYGENGQTLALGGGQQVVFRGRSLEQIGSQEAPPQDSFDRWTSERDRREDQSITARYVPREVTGYQELDSHGKWSTEPALGPVWTPFQNGAGWAPFRHGRWDWVGPWGWTWIDDATWGFATSHYGRWAMVGGRWAWVPGRLSTRPVYAPALVAFAGNPGASGTVRLASGRLGVAWFPLGPGESWRPAYRASPVYVSNVNRSMAAGEPAGGAYAHRRAEAITAVALDDFHPGWPVRPKTQRLASGEVAKSLAVAPPPDPGRTGAPEGAKLQLAGAVPVKPVLAQAAAQQPAAAQPPITITREQVQLALQMQQSEQARREEPQRAQAPAQAQAQADAKVKAQVQAEAEAKMKAQAEAKAKARANAEAQAKLRAQALAQAAAREKAERDKAEREQRAAQAQAQAQAQARLLAKQKADRQRELAQREALLQRALAQRALEQARAQQQAKAQRETVTRQDQARRLAQAQAQKAQAQAQAKTQAQAQSQSQAEALVRHETQVRRAIGLANADAQTLRDAQDRRDAQARREEQERQDFQRRPPLPFIVSPPPPQAWPQQGWPQPRDRRS